MSAAALFDALNATAAPVVLSMCAALVVVAWLALYVAAVGAIVVGPACLYVRVLGWRWGLLAYGATLLTAARLAAHY